MDEIDKLLAKIDATPKQTPAQANKSVSTSNVERLLSEVKADYQRKQQKAQQQKIKEIEAQAISWLKNLDPMSSEGLWFTDFAKKYPSKIAAAVEYLRSLSEHT